MKLRTKYLLFVEGGVAAGILILSVAMYGMAAAELEDQAGSRLAEACELVAAEAERAFSGLVREVEFLALSPLAVETAVEYRDPRRVEAFGRYFLRVRDRWGVFQSINLVNPGADCVATSNMEGNRLYHPEHKRMVSGRTDFKEAMAGRTAVSERIVSRGTGRPCLAVSAPIRRDDSVIAVLRAVVDLEFFSREYVASLPIGHRGRVLVLDPALDLLPTPAVDEPIARQPYVRPDVAIPPDQRENSAGLFRYQARDGRHMAAFRRLDPFGWVIVADQPVSEILHPVGRFRTTAFAVAAALVLVMGSAMFLLSRPAMRALEKCQRFAEAIGGGRPVTRLQVKRKDEIGLLAQNLDKMAAGLAQREKEREAAHHAREQAQETERLLAEARWQSLRYQVNPHFLYNVLNSLEALSRSAPERIPELIRNLSAYLRLTLQAPDERRHPMRQELDALKAYLAIEKVRFEEKLDVAFDIAPETEDVEVPDLLLQPVVENALKFGMRTSPLPLRVRIAAELSDGRLRIRVRNTGQWVGEAVDPASPHLRVGMENLHGRLRMFYGDAWQMAVETSGGWIAVALDLPLSEPSTA